MSFFKDSVQSATKLSVGTGNNAEDFVEVASVDTTGKAQVVSMTLDTGTKTATATAGAATLNKNAGAITSESITTAAGSDYTLTLTNSTIAATSLVMVSVRAGTNTTVGLDVHEVTPAAGSCTIKVRNNHASDALNGTIVISFIVVN